MPTLREVSEYRKVTDMQQEEPYSYVQQKIVVAFEPCSLITVMMFVQIAHMQQLRNNITLM